MTTTPDTTPTTASTTATEPIHVLIARELKALFQKWGVSVANAKWAESDDTTVEFVYTRDGHPSEDGHVPADYAGVQLTSVSVSRRDL